MKNKLILDSETTLEKAIKLLDDNGNGFLPITDEAGILLGIITDGDLRRAILQNVREVREIMNSNPKTMPYGTHKKTVLNALNKMHRKQMPLVDVNGVLKDVVVLNDFEVEPKENWVVLMVGGLGSRLGDLTKKTPKPMLEVAGKPILEHIINNFKDFGFHKFVFCVNYKSHIIQDYFGNGESYGVEIRYTKEKKRMGTAGALGLIDFDLETDFFVANGDIITSLNYEDFFSFHKNLNSEATMCVKKYSHQIPFACVQSDENNNLIALEEKPVFDHYINTGLYLLKKSVLSLIPENKFYDMPSLFIKATEKGLKVKTFSMDEYWLDIGRPEDYSKGNKDLSF